jgi:hypothetical protein
MCWSVCMAMRTSALVQPTARDVVSSAVTIIDSSGPMELCWSPILTLSVCLKQYDCTTATCLTRVLLLCLCVCRQEVWDLCKKVRCSRSTLLLSASHHPAVVVLIAHSRRYASSDLSEGQHWFCTAKLASSTQPAAFQQDSNQTVTTNLTSPAVVAAVGLAAAASHSMTRMRTAPLTLMSSWRWRRCLWAAGQTSGSHCLGSMAQVCAASAAARDPES